MNATTAPVCDLATEYRAVRDIPAERQRIQILAIAHYRPKVRAMLEHLHVPDEHRRDGEQVGAIGILRALHKFDPRAGGDFEALLTEEITTEILAWRLGAFAGTLTPAERAALCDTSRSVPSPRYLRLVELGKP